jgi:hypothetical protein
MLSSLVTSFARFRNRSGFVVGWLSSRVRNQKFIVYPFVSVQKIVRCTGSDNPALRRVSASHFLYQNVEKQASGRQPKQIEA